MPKADAFKPVATKPRFDPLGKRGESSSSTVVLRESTNSIDPAATEEAPPPKEEEKDDWETREIPLYTYKDTEFMVLTRDGKPIVPTRLLVNNVDEVEDMINALKRFVRHENKIGSLICFSPIGFDMEWRVQMVRGLKERPTAVV